MLSYRNALELLSEEKRAEAMRWAERIARSLDLSAARPRVEIPPDGIRVLLVGTDGAIRILAGEPLDAPVFQPVDGAPPNRSVAAWVPEAGGSVVAYAPVPAREGAAHPAHVVRVDLRASLLGSQSRSLGILTVVVLAADAAVAVWLVLFLRRILTPYDALLATARAHGKKEDEAEFLLRTLERALTNADEPEPGESDLELLRKTLGSSLEEGLLLLDRAGRSLMVNPRARELLGLEAHAEREAIEVVLSPHPALLRSLRQPLAEEKPLPPTEVRIDGFGDGGRRLAISVTPLRRIGGELMGFLVLLSDVTHSSRQADERRLSESLSHLGELSAGVAHELRNGLATVRGYLQLLETAKDPETREPYLRELDAETRHLERVVTDFLSFARPGTAHPEPIDLESLVLRLCRRPDLAPVELESGEPAEVLGDPVLLSRALDNLLRNAREANELAGRSEPVSVRIEQSDGGARVEIVDRGPGLPAGIRDRLFHPFASTKAGGAGLGLALAHRVVTLHGGRLHLEDREGGGVRAIVWLPGRSGEEGKGPEVLRS